VTGAPRSKVALIADSTVSGLRPFLESGEAPHLDVIVAPFNQVTPLLLDAEADCWRQQPDAAFVWTRPQTAVPSFGAVIGGEAVPVERLLDEVDQFARQVAAAAGRIAALFVASWTMPPYDRGLGILNLDSRVGPGYLLARMNVRLIEALAGHPRVRVLDAARWVASAGEAGASPKLWHLGKIAFGPDVQRLAAADLKAGMRALRGAARKLVVLDLDETLWGGVVGDVGWQSLRLGGHDPVGEAFVAFQHGLRRLSRRGVLLGIVSKNTEAIALEAIDGHPEMVLRRQDFAGWRINWDDKAANLAALADELDLGLDSVVFIDDNPAERARVRGALPQVLVPDWPADRLAYERALTDLTCFDGLTLTDEDRARTRSYVSERERRTARQQAESIDDYLASLQLIVSVEVLGPSNLPRAAQLLNKTNQMNLATRRLAEAELGAWSARPGHCTLVFRVADRFDDYGLTGLASAAVDGDRVEVADFLLSCRVMGRGVEETMVAALVEHARSTGASRIHMRYLETPKNGPCRLFLEQRSRFRRSGEGAIFCWDLGDSYPAPPHVTLQGAPSTASAS
jgi:FkbH-like protein